MVFDLEEEEFPQLEEAWENWEERHSLQKRKPQKILSQKKEENTWGQPMDIEFVLGNSAQRWGSLALHSFLLI